MEKIINNKVRKNLNEHTARIILERSDRMASSTLEQLRKSTDRAYTMTGFLLTVFIALTAFVFSSPSLMAALYRCCSMGRHLYCAIHYDKPGSMDSPFQAYRQRAQEHDTGGKHRQASEEWA